MTSDYAWIIDRDHLHEEDPGIGSDERSVQGPRDAPSDWLLALRAGGGRTFKMYDDDDVLYYTGRITGDYDGFEPLEDFGMPNAGCTGIKYPGSGPEYGGGKYL